VSKAKPRKNTNHTDHSEVRYALACRVTQPTKHEEICGTLENGHAWLVVTQQAKAYGTQLIGIETVAEPAFPGGKRF